MSPLLGCETGEGTTVDVGARGGARVWDRTEPGPELPSDVVAGTRARYVEAFERLTSVPFERYVGDPASVLCE